MKEFELFERWAPKDGAWSPWVKPVLFAAERVASLTGLAFSRTKALLIVVPPE